MASSNSNPSRNPTRKYSTTKESKIAVQIVEFTLTITPSMLAPRYQLTLPAEAARMLRLKKDRRNFMFLTEPWYAYLMKFKRQKHPGVGWRSDPELWKEFLHAQPLVVGDLLEFRRIFYKKDWRNQGEILFDVRTPQVRDEEQLCPLGLANFYGVPDPSSAEAPVEVESSSNED